MGTSESKRSSAAQSTAAKTYQLPQDVLDRVHSSFTAIAQNGKFFDYSQLQAFIIARNTGEEFRRALCCFFCGEGNDVVTFDTFATKCSLFLNGGSSERAGFVTTYYFSEDIAPQSDKVHHFALALTALFLRLAHDNVGARTWGPRATTGDMGNDDFANCLLDGSKGCTVEKWFERSALVDPVLEATFAEIFAHGGALRRLPICSAPNEFSSILSIPYVYFLAQQLYNPTYCAEWKLLYSAAIHGESFAQMTNRIIMKGPTVIVVLDDHGHMFGGFASKPWAFGPQFFGDEGCFLFSLKPDLKIYAPTGYNDHYCYLNTQQQTLPNGVGMGGKLGTRENPMHYFGLWLAEDPFGYGHSQGGSTTFGNQQLSGADKFKFVDLEVWGVDPSAVEGVKYTRPSVLDRDPEIKAILAMAGRGPHSEGLREGDSKSELPGDSQLHSPPTSQHS